MNSYNYSYNVLINRLEAFAAGHFLIRRFTHGQIDMSDQLQDDQYPFMHVTPDTIEPVPGAMNFGFHIMFADIPRDKEYKAEYQREVISDCIRLGQDLIAEVKNGLELFGFDVQLLETPTFEPFMEEQKNTVTGIAFTLKLSVPWDWSACDIPAIWSVGGVSGTGGEGTGYGITLRTNGVDNVVQTLLDLVEGTGITITDNGNGSVTIDSEAGVVDYVSTAYDANHATATGNQYVVGDRVWYNSNVYQCIANNDAIIPTNTTYWSLVGAGYRLRQTPVDWNATTGDFQILNKPTITAPVNADWNASSGLAEILNKPTIPAAQVNSDWNAASGVAQILNKPTLATVATSGSYNDLSNQPTIPTTLDSLTDVNTPAPTNGQVLTYNTSTGQWIASTPTSASGTVTSVALTAPAAFNVTGSPITTSGTLAISAAGTSAQYVRGDGQLATTPTALPPNGAAGGDLSGTYPNPTVSRIHGIDMQSGTPTANDVWLYGGSPAKWQHQAVKTVNSTSIFGSGNIATGTVTSVAALTLGTSGTDLASSVANGTTTPTITLNVPTASATNRGALSSADWSTFNGKQDALVSGTNIKTINSTSLLGSGNISIVSSSLLYQSQNATNIPAASTYFGCLFGGALSIVSADTLRRTPIASGGTLTKLYVQTSTAQPGTGSLVCTVRKNSVDQALTLTIAAGSAAGVFTDLVNSVSVAAGDLLGMKFQNNAPATVSANVLSNQVIITI